MSLFSIHPTLLEESYYLGSLPSTEVLLHRNGSLPWFILVPETELQDVLDLPRDHLDGVMADCAAISSFIKKVLGFDKINFAGLGNVVPQMHLHIIGRATVDPCWPQPIWGNMVDAEPYVPGQVEEWQQMLVRTAGLEAAKMNGN
jgi:diadenosine tetraphosphate (Ap4A) HIT family hydrolase